MSVHLEKKIKINEYDKLSLKQEIKLKEKTETQAKEMVPSTIIIPSNKFQKNSNQWLEI